MAAVTAVVVVGGAMTLALLKPPPERNTEPLPLVTETPTAPVGRPLFGNSGPAVATPPSDAPSPEDEVAPGEDTSDLVIPTSIPTETIPSVTAEPGGRLARPVNGPITSRFGMRFHPVLKVWKLHTGLDFAADCGTPVGAAAPGTVVSTGWAGGNGVQVRVDHGVINGHRVVTTYNHLSVVGVTTGQHVDVHQGLGRVGSTGYSTACHLHFEVIVDGDFQDPEPWLTNDPVVVSESATPTEVPTPIDPSTSTTAPPTSDPVPLPTATPPNTTPPTTQPPPATSTPPTTQPPPPSTKQPPPPPTSVPTQPSSPPSRTGGPTPSTPVPSSSNGNR
ncbi:MAG: M23 family metallopeptidase [Propionibacteriaceae bacterium]|nr:M23 family metallopeptidase [Propionibacteriaceae bacterium]